MKVFEEWLKDQEPQYHEDITLSEHGFYERIYSLEKKLEAIKTWRAKWFRKGLVDGPFLRPIKELDKILDGEG